MGEVAVVFSVHCNGISTCSGAEGMELCGSLPHKVHPLLIDVLVKHCLPLLSTAMWRWRCCYIPACYTNVVYLGVWHSFLRLLCFLLKSWLVE